jgi:integrase
MSLKLFKRGQLWRNRGTVAGRRLRGSTGTTDKARAERIADEKEAEHWKCHLDRPSSILTFANPTLPTQGYARRQAVPFPWSESQLRRFWDEDVARMAAAVPGFERLTYHRCRHGFATSMLRDGIDPKTAAALGGWDDIGLFMTTYAHAIQDATLTERLFGTELTQPKIGPRKNKRLRKNKDPSGGTTGRVKAIWALGVDGRSRRI